MRSEWKVRKCNFRDRPYRLYRYRNRDIALAWVMDEEERIVSNREWFPVGFVTREEAGIAASQMNRDLKGIGGDC